MTNRHINKPSQKYSFGRHVSSAHASWLLSQLPSSKSGFGILASAKKNWNQKFYEKHDKPFDRQINIATENSMQTCCDIAIINILLKIANLSHNIEQKSNRTFELKYFAIQTQIIFRAFVIGPHFMRWTFRIPIEFWVFETFYGILETAFNQIPARSYKYIIKRLSNRYVISDFFYNESLKMAIDYYYEQ